MIVLAGMTFDFFNDLIIRYVLSPLAAAIATVGAIALVLTAARNRLLDVPNERSSHAYPVPRGGGVGITAGIVMALLPMMAYSSSTLPRRNVLIAVSAAALIAFVVGLWDDVKSLRPWPKFLGLAAAAAPLVWFGSLETVHGVPYAPEIQLGVVAYPLTVLWLACYPNAFNFMDGINGIAGMTALVSAAFYVAAAGVWSELSVVATATAVASLAFLPFNFPMPVIFMGDSGSLPLGLMLAWCAVRADQTGAMPFPASILLLGPFLFDVTFTLVRRGIEGKRIGEAHKEHLYQRLSRVWGSHANVSLLYAGFSVVTGCLALSYAGLSDTGRLLSLVLPLAAMLGFAAFVLRAERKKGS